MGNEVTRFPRGVNNVLDTSLLADMGQPDPGLFHTYMQDFDETLVAADWIISETQAGATQLVTAGDGGLLVFTNTAANNDLNAMQKTPVAWGITVGKKLFFKTRVSFSEPVLSSFVLGLQVADTTPLDVTDGIYFLRTSAAGIATVVGICRKDATTGSISTAAFGVVPVATFVDFSFYYDGDSKVVFDMGGYRASLAVSAAYLPDTNMAVSFGIQNGEALAKNMTVDYVLVAKER